MSFAVEGYPHLRVNIDEDTIQDRCTEAVFNRGQTYRGEGRIQRIERFDDVVTAAVQGSTLYDVTVERNADSIDPRCTCPYDGPGDCKHVVAVLLDVTASPPEDKSERIDPVLDAVSPGELRAFVRDILSSRPELRDRFLAGFDEPDASVEDYRREVEQLFDQHTQDYPAVTDAIDFSRLFEIAEQHRDRGHDLAAATVYRAVFEGIDDNMGRIDAAYDHYAETIQSALDGYVECVLAADPDPEVFDTYAEGLADRTSSDPPINNEPFRRALEKLEERR